jgi:hypothetical protein
MEWAGTFPVNRLPVGVWVGARKAHNVPVLEPTVLRTDSWTRLAVTIPVLILSLGFRTVAHLGHTLPVLLLEPIIAAALLISRLWKQAHVCCSAGLLVLRPARLTVSVVVTKAALAAFVAWLTHAPTRHRVITHQSEPNIALTLTELRASVGLSVVHLTRFVETHHPIVPQFAVDARLVALLAAAVFLVVPEATVRAGFGQSAFMLVGVLDCLEASAA